MTKMELKDIIRNARKKKGLTQREVAEAIGIQLNHYQHFEYSKRVPSGEIMIKLIKTLDLNLNDIEKALESSKNA
jgi:transcriptional regulator with XRE-family HTH domain